MIKYKNFVDPVRLNIQKFQKKVSQMKSKEETENSNQSVDIFLMNIDHYCETFSNREITENEEVINSIMQFDKNIYQDENVIPQIILSNLFNDFIEAVDYYEPVLYIFYDMINCSYDNLILLLQNGLIKVLLDKLAREDDDDDNGLNDIPIKCFLNIISEDYEEDIYRKTFIFSLIASTNVIQLMYNVFFRENLKETTVESLMEFFLFFFYGIPIDLMRKVESLKNFEDLFGMFVNESKDESIDSCFNKDSFLDIISNGISLSKDSIYFGILQQLLKFATFSDNANIILMFLRIIFNFLYRDISTYKTFFIDLKITSHSDGWIELKDAKILEELARILALIFSEPHSNIDLPSEEINQLSIISRDIFDFSSRLNNEEFEFTSVCALGNLIGFDYNLAEILLENEDITSRIISKPLQSSFRLSRIYLYLVLSIAGHIRDPFRILNDDLMEKIMEHMEKLQGNFVEYALFYIDKILYNQSQQNCSDFKKFFLDFNGDSMLLEMIDNSESESVVNTAVAIYDKYINTNPYIRK